MPTLAERRAEHERKWQEVLPLILAGANAKQISEKTGYSQRIVRDWARARGVEVTPMRKPQCEPEPVFGEDHKCRFGPYLVCECGEKYAGPGAAGMEGVACVGPGTSQGRGERA